MPAPGQELVGLGLTTRLVLPHHDRAGRAARHREAAARFGSSVNLVPLWGGEVLLEDSTGWCIHDGALVTRPARESDAAVIEVVFRAATQAAWAVFLGEDRLRATAPDSDRWRPRIADAGGCFLVAEDAEGVLGFVFSHRVEDADLDSQAVGELDLLYTLPRAWGAGIGRRLLDRATFGLLAAGYREAVLWTEVRNERALAVYRRNGWILDGAFKDRDYLGVPIRNLRHRLDLRTHGGGGQVSG
jgi:GNAT superfamily N-acetyltransferase